MIDISITAEPDNSVLDDPTLDDQILDVPTLDARGLKCPLPVLRARRAMKPLATGDVLLMLATDPAAKQDVPAFCETTGHVLKKHDSTELEGEAVLRFWIEKS